MDTELSLAINPHPASLIVLMIFGFSVGLPVLLMITGFLYERVHAYYQQLQASEARYRFLVEHSSDVIARLDMKGPFLYLSPSCERLWGYKPEELIGHSGYELVHPDDVEPVHQFHITMATCTAHNPHKQQFRTRHKDGHTVWIEVLAWVIEDAITHQPVEIVSNIRDITAQKQLEQAQHQYQQELQQHSQELAHRNHELKHANATLVRANHELWQFNHLFSHDIRTPLTGLKGLIDELTFHIGELNGVMAPLLVHLDPLQRQRFFTWQDDCLETVGFIREACAKMMRLVEVASELSRLGHRDVQIEPIDLAALVGRLLAGLHFQLKSVQAQVEVGTLPTLLSDPQLLEQILTNLLTNAIKYRRPQVPLHIQITADTDLKTVTLQVRDNGQGIAADDLPYLFDLFWRSEQVVRAGIEGQGAGLAYVQAMVNHLGGQITVTSQLGVGSTFRVCLPKEVSMPVFGCSSSEEGSRKTETETDE